MQKSNVRAKGAQYAHKAANREHCYHKVGHNVVERCVGESRVTGRTILGVEKHQESHKENNSDQRAACPDAIERAT